MEKVLLDDVSVWFVHVKGELEQAVVIKKHIECIQKTANIPVVLIVKKNIVQTKTVSNKRNLHWSSLLYVKAIKRDCQSSLI